MKKLSHRKSSQVAMKITQEHLMEFSSTDSVDDLSRKFKEFTELLVSKGVNQFHLMVSLEAIRIGRRIPKSLCVAAIENLYPEEFWKEGVHGRS